MSLCAQFSKSKLYDTSPNDVDLRSVSSITNFTKYILYNMFSNSPTLFSLDRLSSTCLSLSFFVDFHVPY